jgi:hypothetical protein
MKSATNNKARINPNIGCDNNTTDEVGTTKLLTLQIHNNLHISPIHEGYHTTHKNRYFKISLLCFPFHHVIWNYVLRKYNRDQRSI